MTTRMPQTTRMPPTTFRFIAGCLPGNRLLLCLHGGRLEAGPVARVGPADDEDADLPLPHFEDPRVGQVLPDHLQELLVARHGGLLLPVPVLLRRQVFEE